MNSERLIYFSEEQWDKLHEKMRNGEDFVFQITNIPEESPGLDTDPEQSRSNYMTLIIPSDNARLYRNRIDLREENPGKLNKLNKGDLIVLKCTNTQRKLILVYKYKKISTCRLP